ncbi:MAG: hypothetical protein ED559_12800 [Phycisphaera sp.]|nr:MAG: hypothetical protein ED559_12800 [Phycisphaera sp.]
MGQSRHHYESAVESHLRGRRIPFISVNEARRTLLPADADLCATEPGPNGDRKTVIKSFDHVIYGEPTNLLVDIKGRKVKAGRTAATVGRLESWVTEDDILALGKWETLFGEGFRAAFVFVYWCEDQPPDALFQEIFEHNGRWYAVRAVLLEDYRKEMVPRSKKWRTVCIPTARFEEISAPLTSSPSLEFRGKTYRVGVGSGDEVRNPRFAPALAAR